MKKQLCLFILLLLLLTSLLLGGCDDGPGPGREPLTDSVTASDGPSDSSTASTEADTEGDRYGIVGREYDDFHPVLISFEDSRCILRVNLPEEWELEDDGQGDLRILYEGEQIGTATDDPNPPAVGQVLETESNEFGILPSRMEITVDENGNYYRLFYFRFEDGSGKHVRFCIDYGAISAKGSVRLLYGGFLRYSATDPGYGMLGFDQSMLNSGISVLVLGNSFVGSSDIGNLLRAMLPSNCTVTAISRGYATVSGTYSKDDALLAQIGAGEYDLVLLCGFYSDNDTGAARTLLDACQSGGAKLALFPAHNENSSAVQAAVAKYDGIYLLDWMAELNALIKQGVPLRSLAIDDAYGHSTPLAGYVGAHMVYRAIYGENPDALFRYGQFDQDYVDSILGDYAEAPSIQLVDPELLIYFKK